MNRLTASEGTLAVYKDLWQLEVWLRRLVYIELKTKYGRTLEAQFDKAKDFLKKSQAYHHMPAAEGELVSYMLMRGLLIMIERHWDMFEQYLMPKKQWDARMDEIEHIRNRVAHFRHGHPDAMSASSNCCATLTQSSGLCACHSTSWKWSCLTTPL